jgi:hypothetical protein
MTNEAKNEATMTECPRCHGEGRIKAFGHVKEGICFRCWGHGGDIVGALKELDKELARTRAEWKRDQKALKAAEVAGKDTTPYLQVIEGTTHYGVSLRRRWDRLTAQLAAYRAQHNGF